MPRQDRYKKAKKSMLHKSIKDTDPEKYHQYLTWSIGQKHREERKALHDAQRYEVHLINHDLPITNEGKAFNFNQWMLQRRELGQEHQRELDRLVPGERIFEKFYEAPFELLDMINLLPSHSSLTD